jgi:hypothetical protein
VKKNNVNSPNSNQLVCLHAFRLVDRITPNYVPAGVIVVGTVKPMDA